MNVSFHQVDHSDALKRFIEHKSAKLHKFLNGSEKMSWVVERDGDQFSPVLKLSLKRKKISLDDKSSNVFRAVKNNIDRAFRILRRRHSKISSHK